MRQRCRNRPRSKGRHYPAIRASSASRASCETVFASQRCSYRGRALADLGRNAERDLGRVRRLSRERRTATRAPDLLDDFLDELGGQALSTSESDVFPSRVDVRTERRLGCHLAVRAVCSRRVPFLVVGHDVDDQQDRCRSPRSPWNSTAMMSSSRPPFVGSDPPPRPRHRSFVVTAIGLGRSPSPRERRLGRSGAVAACLGESDLDFHLVTFCQTQPGPSTSTSRCVWPTLLLNRHSRMASSAEANAGPDLLYGRNSSLCDHPLHVALTNAEKFRSCPRCQPTLEIATAP